jgi:outer membrane protein assembly factor BamA
LEKIYKHLITVSLFFLGFFEVTWVMAQTEPAKKDTFSIDHPEKVIINNIFIVGNEKTRKNIILREIDLETGITYDWDDLISIIQADQKKIYNLQLFNSVEITPLLTENEQIEVLVTVAERWYILPNIIFNLADRNIAEWWTNQNRDFSRVNYGARLLHNNVGGRNEKLKVGAQFGFTKAFELLYTIPYLDRNQNHGISGQFTYFTQKTIPIRSAFNKQVFYTNENEEVLRKNSSAYFRYSYRASFYNFHFVTFGYNNTIINPDVFIQNPDYFLHESTKLNYFVLGYTFRHDRRNNIQYATEGELLSIGITKYGLFSADDIDDAEIILNANKYFKFGDKFNFASGLSLSSFYEKRQPFTLVRGIGYNPYFIRGYELNVVEGQQTVVHKNSFRFKFIDKKYDIGKFVPLEEFSILPLQMYLGFNFDHGFVNDRNNLPENARLTNKYLFGYGPGIDVVTLYDMVFRFEYSLNNQGEQAFFFNFRAPF